MCDPITLISLGLTVGSSVLQGAAANDAAKARNSAMAAERTRQDALRQKQTALSSESQGEMATFKDDEVQRKADLTSYFQEPVAGDANAEMGMVAPQGTSSITTREMDKQSAEATGRANKQGASLANLRAFGDLMGDKMRGIGRNSSEIDQFSGFRRGSTDALAYELDAAAQKGAGKKMLGDIMGGLGSIGSSYAAMSNAGNQTVTGWLGGMGGGKAGLAPAASLRPRPNPMLGA